MVRTGHIIPMVAVTLMLLIGLDAHAGKVELLMFESPTCEWCRLWRKEVGPVYPKTEEGRLAPLRSVSVHAPRPSDLSGIDGIVFTPTFVLWNGRHEIGRIVGYSGEIQFWGLLDSLIRRLKSDAPASAKTEPPEDRQIRGTPVERPTPSAR